MSPQNRMRLIRVAEFVRSPRFMICMLLVEILLLIWCVSNAFYIMALIALITALLDLRALRAWAANRSSQRYR